MPAKETAESAAKDAIAAEANAIQTDAEPEVIDNPGEAADPKQGKGYILKGVGGVPDGDWLKLSDERKEWVRIHHPDVFEAIENDIAGGNDTDVNKAVIAKKQAVVKAEAELAKVNGALAEARVANQRVEEHHTLDERAAQVDAALQAAKAETAALKEATKRGQKL